MEAEWRQIRDENAKIMDNFLATNIKTAADYFEEVSEARKDQIFMCSVENPDRIYTYGDVDRRANQVAHWALTKGIGAKDVVALMMENCCEFIWLWIGLSKIGATIACINTGLGHEQLSHALDVAQGKHAIVSKKMRTKWDSAQTTPYTVFTAAGISGDPEELELELSQHSSDRPNRTLRESVDVIDALFYIYTSGTTGRSKAARFNHRRFIGAGVTWARAMRLRSDDRYYVTLPLYHGNGGVVAVSSVLRAGCRLVLREKFSVSNFLTDVRRFGCTATIYIGEMWRYLYNSPAKEDDFQNPLRVAAGNGLRGEIWEAVCERFGIELIVEHYGQTEMPSAHPMINCYNKVGSCGYIPRAVLGELEAECLIRFDVENEAPVRDTRGRCIRCGPGEVGEAIVRLDTAQYSGYTSKEATDKVIYRSVFQDGDVWYHSSDLLRYDEDGFFYFVDRIGDTFRWKGENVATGEVVAVVGKAPGVLEANVYGVKVPHTEGRAGMASLFVAREQFQLPAFHTYVCEHLPPYARPLFLRMRTEENMKTGTFKFQKFSYQGEGFDIHRISTDDIFFRDDEKKSYVELTATLYEKIMQGHYRL